MARIEHRRAHPGHSVPVARSRPALALLFAVLAAFVGVAELWPVVDAWWFIQASEPWSALPSLLPTAARNAAIVALPAAVAVAAPRAAPENRWLWRGAVLAAVVQLLRYPWDLVSARLIDDALVAGLVPGGELQSIPYLVVVAISLGLAVLSALGVWALSKGLADAGGRLGRSALALITVAVLAAAIVVFGPALASAGENLVLGMASMLSNGLFLLAHGLLAGRATAGAVRRAPPMGPWRAGALAAGFLVALPLVTLLQLLLGQLVPDSGQALPPVILLLATYAGWPLLTLAIALGMGRRPAHSAAARRSHELSATPRFVAPLAG